MIMLANHAWSHFDWRISHFHSGESATEHDLALMRASVSENVQVKAAGGVRDSDGLIKVRDLGGTRCRATTTACMLDEYRRHEAMEQVGQDAQSTPGEIGTGGYLLLVGRHSPPLSLAARSETVKS
ncbi:MAG: hypothetical protein JW829_04590 [Pirellulales bacterium]|nr:hypothetical protein [Pirellulales bacterium]